jgi:uncharacterized protein YecT (DUF1311 family)
MRLLIAVFLVVLSAAGQAQVDDAVAEALQDCDKNQRTMNLCACHSFRTADRELNELFTKQLSSLKTQKTKKRLQDAQRAWLVFRDRDCLYEVGPSEESGSIWPMEHCTCMAKRTQRRVVELREFLACKEATDACPQ